MSKLKKRLIFLLVVLLALQKTAPLRSGAAERQYRMNLEIIVDGTDIGCIAAFDDTYENNLYLSLSGLAYALRDTEKSFAPAVEKQKISISTQESTTLRPFVWDEEELDSVGKSSASRYELYLDDAERKYYSFILPVDDGFEAFMTPVSLALLLDLNMEVTSGRIEVRTSEHFSVTGREMEEAGYLQGVNALLAGDGSTGEIYYRYGAEEVFPIASTTKLMTYLILMDAVSQGKCSLEDTVVLSENAAKLSRGPDGVIPMKSGSIVSLTDLLYGMLLLSSNESALAVAEHTAGSEEAFVLLMNEKARELGLENAVFYNCHGLPFYEDQLIPAKIQNRMTAEEMFLLASYLMDTYPQITDFTSVKSVYMDTLGMEAKNTNAVLYNMEHAVGLKTGTTNKAGACLVTCIFAVKDGEKHHLITVLLGAEGDASRGIISEIAARYAEERLAGGNTDPDETGDFMMGDTGIPADPETVVKKLLKMLK